MEPIFIAAGALAVFILGLFAMFAKFYRKIEQGHALIVNTLLFIEDRALLDNEYPRQNPAVTWHRFVLAAAGQVGGVLDPERQAHRGRDRR